MEPEQPIVYSLFNGEQKKGLVRRSNAASGNPVCSYTRKHSHLAARSAKTSSSLLLEYGCNKITPAQVSSQCARIHCRKVRTPGLQDSTCSIMLLLGIYGSCSTTLYALQIPYYSMGHVCFKSMKHSSFIQHSNHSHISIVIPRSLASSNSSRVPSLHALHHWD